MLSRKIYTVHEIVGLGLLIGAFLEVAGTFWDMQYHLDIGRDSFWIRPHLAIYAGVFLMLLSGIFGFILIKRLGYKNTKGLLFSLLLSSIGQFTILFAAPLDNLYHEIVGLDATVWSPPHFLLIFGGSLGIIGFIAFQRAYLHSTKMERAPGIVSDEFKLEFGAALGLIGFNILVTEFEYYRSNSFFLHNAALGRPPELYLAIWSVLFCFMFVFFRKMATRPWAVTRIAVLFFVTRSLFSIFLHFHGPSWPILPPLVIIPAIVFDLISLKKFGAKEAAISSVIFILVFYAVEKFWLPFTDAARFVVSNFGQISETAILGALTGILALMLSRRILLKIID